MHTGVNDRMEPVENPQRQTNAHRTLGLPPNGNHMIKLSRAAIDMVMISTLNLPMNLSAKYPGIYLPRIPTAFEAVIMV